MATIPIVSAGQYGVVRDELPHTLPMNAWSDAKNMHFVNGYAEKMNGHSQVFGTPNFAPYFLMPVPGTSSYFWLYAGLAAVACWDGGVHTDITRAAGGAYSATLDNNWTGDVLGGIGIINNGIDDPQMWLPVSAAQRLQLLSNWPANTKCGALRAFKNYLVAVDVTKVGVRYPQMVKWSHPAAAGAVPSSWDPLDTTKDAGEVLLSETGDFCVDSVPLRDVNIIYKENSVIAQQLVGGTQIFRFPTLFKSVGILTRRCAAEYFSGKHAVFGDGDIYTHDGQNATSIIDKKLRKYIYNQIDSSNFRRSFVAVNFNAREVWFCYPETGQSLPNIALVWNFQQDTLGFRDLPSLGHAAPGVIDPGSTSDQWNAASGSWDSDSQVWNARLYNPSLRKLLMAAPTATKLHLADLSSAFDGVAPSSYLERIGLPLPLTANAPPDMRRLKTVTRLWPQIEGTAGASVQIQVGSQMVVNGALVYAPAQNFVIGTTQYIDVLVTGRLLAFKFATAESVDWRLHGFEVEATPRGEH